jgi:hypothetical protein
VYDAEKDEEGKILLTDNHLRAVMELSKDFEFYMMAERRYEWVHSHSQKSRMN